MKRSKQARERKKSSKQQVEFKEEFSWQKASAAAAEKKQNLKETFPLWDLFCFKNNEATTTTSRGVGGRNKFAIYFVATFFQRLPHNLKVSIENDGESLSID